MDGYYILSSLGHIEHLEPVSYDYSQFLSDIRPNLSEQEYQRLQLCQIDRSDLMIYMPEWHQWELALRAQLLPIRAKNLGLSPQPYFHYNEQVYGDIIDLVAQLIQEESPLVKEQMMDKARFDFWDQWLGLRQFTEQALWVYALKLQVNIKHADNKKQAAYQAYEAVYERILGDNNYVDTW